MYGVFMQKILFIISFLLAGLTFANESSDNITSFTYGSLRFQPISESDTSSLHETFFNNSEVMKCWNSGEPWTLEATQTRVNRWASRVENGEPSWWVIRTTNGSLVGALGLFATSADNKSTGFNPSNMPYEGIMTDFCCLTKPELQRQGLAKIYFMAVLEIIMPMYKSGNSQGIYFSVSPENEKSANMPSLLSNLARASGINGVEVKECERFGNPRIFCSVTNEAMQPLVKAILEKTKSTQEEASNE